MELSEAEKRLERLEGKVDITNDKLAAFPVVGQRIADVERRLALAESEIRELRKQVGGNALVLAKVGGIFTVLAVLGTLAIREISSLLGGR